MLISIVTAVIAPKNGSLSYSINSTDSVVSISIVTAVIAPKNG